MTHNKTHALDAASSSLSNTAVIGAAPLMCSVRRIDSSLRLPLEGTVSLAMTKRERETFLADLHVGIISIAEGGRGPLTVPIWYLYEPGGELRVVTPRTSRKAQLLQHAGRFSVCVQTETQPYKYVSVEGPVVAIEPADVERDRRPLAHRYLGAERGDRYIEGTREEYAGNVLVRMLPERWLTVAYAKA